MDSWSQSGGALCHLTGIHPTAGCSAVPCPSGVSLLLKGFGGGFLSWHPCGVGTAVMCASGHSCTHGSICAHQWDAQGTNWGKIMPLLRAVRSWYTRSPLQPPHAGPAMWDQQMGNTQSREQGEHPHAGGGRGRAGVTAGFPLQVAVQPGCLHPLRLLRGPVWAVQPQQPDGAQHGLLPEGLLPSIR